MNVYRSNRSDFASCLATRVSSCCLPFIQGAKEHDYPVSGGRDVQPLSAVVMRAVTFGATGLVEISTEQNGSMSSLGRGAGASGSWVLALLCDDSAMPAVPRPQRFRSFTRRDSVIVSRVTTALARHSSVFYMPVANPSLVHDRGPRRPVGETPGIDDNPAGRLLVWVSSSTSRPPTQRPSSHSGIARRFAVASRCF
jgi:hypothetical protein